MSDARSLLRRAKAAETEKRIIHPLALYNASGQLRCAACGVGIKPHAWDGHVGSKAHRTQAARLRVEEERERERARKRKSEGVEDEDEEDGEEGKRRRVGEEDVVAVEQQPAPAAAGGGGGFPADFFSDPSRAPVLAAGEDEDDADESMQAASTTNQPTSLDDEFAAFAKAVLQPALKPQNADVYESATIMAEPELVTNVPDGFPEGVTGASGAPQEEVEEETDAQKQQRLEQDERELIMDRLRDEELAQEEADDRVVRLKARLEAVRLGKAQGVGAAGAAPSAPGAGVDKKTLLKMLRGKKKAAAPS